MVSDNFTTKDYLLFGFKTEIKHNVIFSIIKGMFCRGIPSDQCIFPLCFALIQRTKDQDQQVYHRKMMKK